MDFIMFHVNIIPNSVIYINIRYIVSFFRMTNLYADYTVVQLSDGTTYHVSEDTDYIINAIEKYRKIL